MGVRFNIAEVVSVVGETLSSIDIRTASVRIDDKWLNVMTVVRLSSDSPATASAGVEETWGKHGAVRTNEFRIDYRVLPFEEWDNLLGEFNQGKLGFSETEVEFGRTVDVAGSLGYIQSRFYSLWPPPEWPMLEISINTTSISDASKNPHTGLMLSTFRGQ